MTGGPPSLSPIEDATSSSHTGLPGAVPTPHSSLPRGGEEGDVGDHPQVWTSPLPRWSKGDGRNRDTGYPNHQPTAGQTLIYGSKFYFAAI